ncbi:MAG: hypothetical protein DRP67_02825 [Candidatus Omnitrophota bacterium]|nr:MAG: hypothetical protein DRP67_02825 [Candidatus Omnitrophota bacterium]
MDKNRIREKRKKQILKAAAEIFGKRGYWKTDMESIAKKAHIAKGTIYLYFKNKENLFLSIIDSGLDALSERMEEELSGIKDFFNKIKRSIQIYLEFFEKNFVYFNIITHENPGLGVKVSEKFWKKFFEKFKKIEDDFKKGISSGIIKNLPVKDAIFSLIGILHGIIDQWILSGRKYSLKRKANTVFEIFVNGIRR